MHKAIQQLLEHFDLANLKEWIEVIVPLTQVILILLLALGAIQLAARLLTLLKTHLSNRSESIEDQKRIETLARVFNYLIHVIIWIVAAMFALSALGFSIAPILATAGVAGIAVGFGAQSLVKDYFTGFVMLMENQIRQGDLVEVAGKSGSVEEITLRYIRLRDYEGAVHFIPNSAINLVTNRSRLFAYAVFEVCVSHHNSLDAVYQACEAAFKTVQNQATYQSAILEPIEIGGIDSLSDPHGIKIRGRVKVAASEQATIRRVLLAAIKNEFDVRTIEFAKPLQSS